MTARQPEQSGGSPEATTIRPRQEGDLVDLVRVAAGVRRGDGYPPFLPGGDVLAFLTRPAPLAAWTAEVGGRAVGHVALNAGTHPDAVAVVRGAGIAGNLGVVARLFVDRSARGGGLGRRLLELAARGATALDRVPVLDVHTAATAAVALYRSCGWQELGRCTLALPGGAPIEEIVFGLPRGLAGTPAVAGPPKDLVACLRDGVGSSATVRGVPTIAGHGSHLDSGGGEELPDL
ncbi:MAG: GNAT family N-acetyltransferase [Acidimicrobiales bacterium]